MAYSLTYSYDSASQSYSVTGYSGITTADKVVIPSTYGGPNGSHPVTSIGDSAFKSCHNLTSITIPGSVTNIGFQAFSGCNSLTSVMIPDSVRDISNYAFSSCSSLTSATIGNNVTSIGVQAFYGCNSLTSVTIPDSVTSISSSAFYDCSSLTSVTIGSGVTSIGNSVFNNCSNLTQLILFPLTSPTLGSSAIPTTISKIYVRQSSKETYKTATNWKSFANKIVSDDLYLSFARFNEKNKQYIEKNKEHIQEQIENSYYTSNPKMSGTASPGTSTKVARGDHVHPKDTSKVNKAGDTMTGTLAAPGFQQSDPLKDYIDFWATDSINFGLSGNNATVYHLNDIKAAAEAAVTCDSYSGVNGTNPVYVVYKYLRNTTSGNSPLRIGIVVGHGTGTNTVSMPVTFQGTGTYNVLAFPEYSSDFKAHRARAVKKNNGYQFSLPYLENGIGYDYIAIGAVSV